MTAVRLAIKSQSQHSRTSNICKPTPSSLSLPAPAPHATSAPPNTTSTILQHCSADGSIHIHEKEIYEHTSTGPPPERRSPTPHACPTHPLAGALSNPQHAQAQEEGGATSDKGGERGNNRGDRGDVDGGGRRGVDGGQDKCSSLQSSHFIRVSKKEVGGVADDGQVDILKSWCPKRFRK